MKILIAEDNRVSRTVLKRYIEGFGYCVYEASDGFEAQMVWEKYRPEMLIADWNMPGLSGLDLLRYIRANGDGHYTYVVFTTSRDLGVDMKTAYDAGVDDYLKKPFSRQELFLRMKAGERLLNLQSKELLVYALARLAETRDKETGAHLERIRTYSRLIAEALGNTAAYASVVDGNFVMSIYETSPLHDIGKVGISDRILLKKGKLTPEEYELMKAHTIIGRNTLLEVSRHGSRPFLKMAIEIAGSHHEWWDGSGYPDGLEGEAIPLSARIVALADVYDALRSRRVYKEDIPHESVVEQIVALKGRQFDPTVVDAFLSIADYIGSVSESFGE
ncbi:HD domain-containing phosphohydrolase [Fusibacter sp. JL298sf-3]